MKLCNFLMFVMLCMSTFTVSATDHKPFKWDVIKGFTHPGINAFVDLANISKEPASDPDDMELTTALILLAYKEPRVITIENKEVPVLSMIRAVVVECESGVMLPLIDFYFPILMPLVDSEPILSKHYNLNVETAETLNKTSYIYKSFCPSYI